MRTLFLMLLLASPLCAGMKYEYKDPQLSDELRNNYKEHLYPHWVNAQGSSATITYIQASSITLNGVNLVAGGTTVSASSVTGTTTNDNATIGRLGEYVESVNTSASPGSTGVFTDLTSISLTAGDWDVTGMLDYISNGATWTTQALGISVTSGNSSTGLAGGENEAVLTIGSSATSFTRSLLTVPVYRMSLSGTTTVYLKAQANYSAGTPAYNRSRLSARRTR